MPFNIGLLAHCDVRECDQFPNAIFAFGKKCYQNGEPHGIYFRFSFATAPFQLVVMWRDYFRYPTSCRWKVSRMVGWYFIGLGPLKYIQEGIYQRPQLWCLSNFGE